MKSSSGEDSFEGFFGRNGKRNGKGRYTWADGTVALCIWSDGCCEDFDEATRNRTEAEEAERQRKRERQKKRERPKRRNAKASHNSGSFSTLEMQQSWGQCDKCGKSRDEFDFECHKCNTKYCEKCEQKNCHDGFKPPCKCLGWESFTTLERQQYWGMCVKCGNSCEEFDFKCLNCETAYCERCEQKACHEGFKNRRPPCKCLINTKGIAVEIQGTALDLNIWKPSSVLQHYQQGRRASSAKIQDLIFVIEFVRKGRWQERIKALCHIGSLETSTQSQLLKTKEIQEYVANFPGFKPPAFCELQNQWQKPPQPYPNISLNTAEIEQDWNRAFGERKEDIDSLDIKNFYLSSQSIKYELPELLQRKQVEIGTGWSAVNPPTGFCIICGPRPSLIVYMGGFNINAVRQEFAKNLKQFTSKHFTTAMKGKNIFQQSAASVDVTELLQAWLTTVENLQQKVPDNDAEIQKMKLLRIIFHGWKSQPGEIDQFPQADDEDDNDDEDLFDRCMEGNQGNQYDSDENCDFEATFDLAQKYSLTEHSELTQDTCMSHIRVPVFGILKPIPGFKAETWSMFGPLPPGNIEMGSIKLDRTGREIDIFPANVKRVKIYPGCVNFLKHFMNQGLNGKTLSKKRLDAIRKKFATILAEISGPNCMEHAEMLMSFRIEFTMALNESQKTLQSLRDQLRPLKAQLLQKLQPYFKSSIIALEDIHTFCRWSLSRYNKICKGNSNTPFDDQLLAKHLVLSLWHGVGYHQFRFTQRMHKDYLVDLDMTGYDTDDDDDNELVAKHHGLLDWSRSHPRRKVDWSRETDAAINTIIQALQYMNIINVSAETTSQGSRLRYMYRRICNFENDNAPCPWCYSEKARNNIAQHPEKQNRLCYPCKSKDFDTSIELAENVYERLKHHHDISSNGCTELIHSMFVAAREKTKEQENVLRDMAEMLKQKRPQYTHELFKEFDKPHEQNQDAPLSKRGRRHVNWSQLTEPNLEAISQALAFMNLFKPTKALRPKQRPKNGTELLSRPVLLQYMYKKVCDVQTGGDPCSWCYSDAACKKLKKNLDSSKPQKTTVACKSNIFDSADKLIEDVCGRLKHHHPDFSSNDWNKTLAEMFFPIQDKNKPEQEQVLTVMREKRHVDPAQGLHTNRDSLSLSIVNEMDETCAQRQAETASQISPFIDIDISTSSTSEIQSMQRFGISAWLPDTHAMDLVSKVLYDRPSTRIMCAQAPAPMFKTPSGLPNERGKNWCYLNSVLQCLRQTTELTGQISASSKTFQLICSDQGYHIASKLRQFLTSDETSMIAVLTQLRQKLAKFDSKFNGDSQECAAEVCETMLLAMFSAHCVSSPVEIFQHTVKAAMKCRQCGCEREGQCQEGIVLHTTLASNMSLQTSIENCWQYELLEGVECICGARRVDRKFNLDTAPNVLIVALKLNYSDTGAKILSTALNEDTVNVGQHRYKIFAVVSHIGHWRVTGHYIAYTERNGNWNCFNDSTVTRSKHWRSELEQDETPCIFFLRKIPGEECSQFSQQHKTSLEKQDGQGNENVEGVFTLVAEEPDLVTSILLSMQGPIRFNDLKTALQALCQLKNCDFKQLPEHWFENQGQTNRKLDYLLLKDHVMRVSHFQKSNATVHEGWSVTPARNVCIKQFSSQCEIQREITALERVTGKGTDASSCNVIEYFGTDQNNNGGTVLIFEMVQASDFYLLSHQYTIDQVKTYMYRLLQALTYLHNHRVIHRDVKPANFLHNFQSDIFRLIDFGSATTEENATGTKGGGTKGFKAPETLMGRNSPTTAVDIWGAGIILFCLLTGKTCCLSGQSDAKDLHEIGMIVGKNKMQQLNVAACDEYGDGCQFENKMGWPAKALQTVIAERTWKPDDVALDLLSKMLQVDHSKRIDSSTAVQHPFFEADKKADHQNLALVIGRNVLARRDAHSQWSPAFVKDGTGTEYQVVFWAGHEERQVTADNIKEMDWKYWKTEMKSWTCDEFDEEIDDSKIEADTEGNIVALANFEIGDVVAKRNGLNAFTEEGGRAKSKQQCNSKLWRVESDNSTFGPNHNKAVFLLTTKRVQGGEKLSWYYKSQSVLCDLKDKVVVLSSAATGTSDSVIDIESQQMLESRTFCIDKTYMNRVKRHFSKDKSVKLLEALLSHNDTFEARISKNTQNAAALVQARQRDERRSKSSAIGERAVPNLQNESAAALGYAESTWATVEKMINLFDKALGSSIPAYYLDIGSGSLAHCAIAASASGRFLVCNGIECGSVRFQASQNSLMSAAKSGILKSPCKIVHGDVLTSRDIELSTYNVYSFFDKVCIEVSQQTLQKVILEHCANNFALGPVMYLTCMGSNELREALVQLQTKMEPSEWNSLTILDNESMNLTTRFAGQKFRCTLVQVRKKR